MGCEPFSLLVHCPQDPKLSRLNKVYNTWRYFLNSMADTPVAKRPEKYQSSLLLERLSDSFRGYGPSDETS